jgi:hypothetical protein
MRMLSGRTGPASVSGRATGPAVPVEPYSAAGKRAFVRRVLAGAGVDLADGRYADPSLDAP